MTATKFGLHQFAEAAENMNMALLHAEQAFHLLARLHGDGDHDGHQAFEAVCTLCAQGLADVEQNNGVVIQHLTSYLRKSSEGAAS